MPEVVSLLLAVVTTVAIVMLFVWPLCGPLVRAWRARRAAVARFIEAVEWGDFAGAEVAVGHALDRGQDTS